MASRTCRPCRGRDPDRARAEAQAQAIIAQGRQVARELLEDRAAAGTASQVIAEEEPMNRYVYPIPQSVQAAGCGCCEDTQQCLDRILETLTCQNQLLIDLLGAVNSLTAATLGAQCRG